MRDVQETASVTITLFLPGGDAKSLHTAEISNWSGKAIAAPRTELDQLLDRSELRKPGIYMLTGQNTDDGDPLAYIGEADDVRERIRQHRTREWTSAIVFVSKDDRLNKAHVRYLERALIVEAQRVGRFTLEQNQAHGSQLSESDRQDMEVFLARVRQLLPVLGSDILVPLAQLTTQTQPGGVLFCRIKGAEAKGQRTATGFVVFKGSTAVSQDRRSAVEKNPSVLRRRNELTQDGTLVRQGDFLVFTKDVEFSSPSAAAIVIRGGNSSGLENWKTADGKTLRELDEEA